MDRRHDGRPYSGRTRGAPLRLAAFIVGVCAALIGGALGAGYASGTPRGAWLAYAAEDIAGIGDIMLYDAARGVAHNLTRTRTQNETRPVWSPDGRWLAFECNYPDHLRGFCLIEPAAAPTAYRRYEGSLGQRPAWSPDGNAISWGESDRLSARGYVLRAADFLASDPPSVGTGWIVGSLYSAMEYAWMPDSAQLVYSSYSDRAARVYLTHAREDEARELPQPESDNFEPTPSPDGRWIAFVSVNGYKRRIMLLDTTTNDYAPLTDGGSIGNDFSPAWSPDGTRLAFLSDRDGADFDVFIMDMDDRELHQVTANYFLDDSLAWSPDGTRLALMSNRDGSFHVYILDLISGGTTRVTHEASFNNFPAWRP